MTRPTGRLPRALSAVRDGIARADTRPRAPDRPAQASDLHERSHGGRRGPSPAIRRPERGAACATGTGDSDAGATECVDPRRRTTFATGTGVGRTVPRNGGSERVGGMRHTQLELVNDRVPHAGGRRRPSGRTARTDGRRPRAGGPRARCRGGDSAITIDPTCTPAPRAARRITPGRPRAGVPRRTARPCRGRKRRPARSNAGPPGAECVRGCYDLPRCAPTGSWRATSGRCAANSGARRVRGRNIEHPIKRARFCDLPHRGRNAASISPLHCVDESWGLCPLISL
jgi:hypothetical protein